MKKNILAVMATALIPALTFAAQPPKNIIAKQEATAIALKASPGKIKSSELEFEKKQWVYSFDIEGSDGKLHEVLVNAKAGNVVENKIESAEDEAREAKEDRKEHKK